MANSLEARSPFLDRELIEYVAALPDDLKLARDAKPRSSCAKRLPICCRRRSRAAARWVSASRSATWFRGELREYMRDVLLAPDARYRAMLYGAFVEQVVARHLSGRANLGHQLWTLMCFERWLQLLPQWNT